MADNSNNVLLSFVMKENENGNPIPSSVSDFLLNGLLHHVDQSASDETDEKEFEKFSDKFELHIRKLKDDHKCQIMNTKPKDWNSIVSQNILLHNDLVSKKKKEAEEVLNLFKKLLVIKNSLEQKLDEAIIYENAGLDLVESKQRILLSKANASLLNETPQTVEALKKLKAYMDNRLKELNVRISDLEESEVQYNEVKNNPEFLKLLSEYNKLLKRKQLIDLN